MSSGVRKKEAVYTTRDGREFYSEDEAGRHDELVEARDTLSRAQHQFGRALAQTTKTADGELFEFGLWRRYYRVVPGWQGMPSLEHLGSFYGHPGFEFDNQGELELVEGGHKPNPKRIRICDMFADKSKAEEALYAAQDEWLEERRAEIESNRARTSEARR